MLMYSAVWKSPQRMPEYSVWYPATSSVSASGRSNGARDDSAVPAKQKQTRPTNCGAAEGRNVPCLWPSSSSEGDSPRMSTPSTESQIELLYDASCALERNRPISENLLSLAPP